jgi:two-component system sensor histidine kinase/response regulator
MWVQRFGFRFQCRWATYHQIRVADEQTKYRILIAEDNVVNRTLLTYILASVGFQVQIAENGEAAIQLWKTWRPHLIFMDINMPVMDGYEATRQIRALENSTPNSPIHSLTPSQPVAQPQENWTASAWTDHYSVSHEESDSSHTSSTHPNCTPLTFSSSLSSLQMATASRFQPSRTVIIALTAHLFDEERQAAIGVGCDDVLSKPFKKDVLYQMITTHLQVNYVGVNQKVAE